MLSYVVFAVVQYRTTRGLVLLRLNGLGNSRHLYLFLPFLIGRRDVHSDS